MTFVTDTFRLFITSWVEETVSAEKLEEVMLLSEIGRVRLPLPFRNFVVSVRQAENYDLGVNDTDLLLEAATFTTVKDPYDRLIIAQARVAGLSLITGDERIQESGLVRTVWD